MKTEVHSKNKSAKTSHVVKVVLLVGFIALAAFLSGCITQQPQAQSPITESVSKIPAVDQSDQKIDAQTPDLIVKSGDVLGLKLGYYFYIAFPQSKSLDVIPDDIIYINNPPRGFSQYTDTLPVGTRYVGQTSNWKDNSGRVVVIRVLRFDLNPGFKNYFSRDLSTRFVCTDTGSPNIGDYSTYCNQSSTSPDVISTRLEFSYGNYYVRVDVTDEKGKSLSEAMEISQKIKSRLD